MTEAFIGIGANLGDPVKTLRDATRFLVDAVKIIAVSRLYRTEPVGYHDQPDFLNGVLHIRTAWDARALLNHLLATELRFGRIREEKWGPRLLDLDVLLYGAAIVEEEGLRVPHPHLTERSFVLAPLCDLAPNARHPILNRSFADLLRSLGSSQAYEVVEGISLMPDSK